MPNAKVQIHNRDCLLSQQSIKTSFIILILNLIVTSHIHYIVLSDEHVLSHSMCHRQVIMTLHFLNGVVNDVESTRKLTITA